VIPSQSTVKAANRGVVVLNDGVIDAFTLGARSKKWPLDLEKDS